MESELKTLEKKERDLDTTQAILFYGLCASCAIGKISYDSLNEISVSLSFTAGLFSYLARGIAIHEREDVRDKIKKITG